MASVCKRLIGVSLLMMATGLSHAQAAVSDIQPADALIKLLQAGGHIIYMRHGITTRKNKHQNKQAVNLAQCDTQRNLTEEGKKQVSRIGRSISALNIPIGHVSSSPFCRTKDTAQAAFGKFGVDDNLAFSMAKEEKESARLGRHLYAKMLASQGKSKNTVFVGHTANLKDGLGIWPKPEGVAVIFTVKDNQVIYKGMIKPDDWPNP